MTYWVLVLQPTESLEREEEQFKAWERKYQAMDWIKVKYPDDSFSFVIEASGVLERANSVKDFFDHLSDQRLLDMTDMVLSVDDCESVKGFYALIKVATIYGIEVLKYKP
jgi:hypothetical protein